MIQINVEHVHGCSKSNIDKIQLWLQYKQTNVFANIKQRRVEEKNDETGYNSLR